MLAAIAAIEAHTRRGDLFDGLIFDAVRIRLLEIGEAVPFEKRWKAACLVVPIAIPMTVREVGSRCVRSAASVWTCS